MHMSVKTKGFNKAKNMITLLAKMGAAYQGIEFPAASRKGPGEKGTNSDVVEHLKDGGRDLGPSEEDATKAAQAYVKVVEQFLRMQPDIKTPPTAAKASMASAKAFRAAAAVVQKILTDRVDKSEDVDGQADEVTKEYAKWRAAKFSMSDDQNQVFKASGQLLANLAQGTGKLKRK